MNFMVIDSNCFIINICIIVNRIEKPHIFLDMPYVTIFIKLVHYIGARLKLSMCI